jgi:O-antigen ligase
MSAPGRAVGGAPDRAREGADLSSVVVAIFVIAGALAAGILAADAAILVVAGASGLMLAVAIVLRPDIATLTTVAILYSNAAVVAVRFHGVPFFVGAFVPLLLVVPLARDLVVRRLPIVAPPMLGWMVVLLLIYLLSALFSIDTTTSWDAVVIFLVEGFGLYFLLVNVIRTPEMLRLTTWVLLASGALVSIPAIHQVLTENYDFMYFGFAQADSAIRTGVTTLTGEVLQPRMAGPIGETNRFAQVMLMLVPLGLFRVIGETSLGLRVLAGLMTVAVTLGVVLSFSRGGAVGLVALVAALVVLRMVRLRYVLVVLLVLAVIVVSFPQYFDRVTSLVAGFGSEAPASEVDNSLLSRATESLAAALVMVDHPIIGVGPGMFPVFYEEYANVVGLLVRNDAERQAHNLYLGLGAEVGIPGLIVFLIIGFLTMRMLLRARRASLVRRPDLERLATPYLLALFTYYVTGMFLHLSFGRFYWLMLAVAGAAAIITLREVVADPDRAEDQGAAIQSV